WNSNFPNLRVGNPGELANLLRGTTDMLRLGTTGYEVYRNGEGGAGVAYATAVETKRAADIILTVGGLLEGARGSAADRGVHIDVGGEGRYADAINLNPGTHTTTTGTAGSPIPNLVQGVGEAMPFQNNTASLITVENSPLRPGIAGELSRVIRPGGEIRLVHPAEYAMQAHQQIINAIGGQATQSTVNGITTTIIRVLK
ncbi:MAG: hypothetical protein HY231_00025, partial [Acidobacteria bacterium]|nr:hypothetical protein [Acidobacteriota bacterium]